MIRVPKANRDKNEKELMEHVYKVTVDNALCVRSCCYFYKFYNTGEVFVTYL